MRRLWCVWWLIVGCAPVGGGGDEKAGVDRGAADGGVWVDAMSDARLDGMMDAIVDASADDGVSVDAMADAIVDDATPDAMGDGGAEDAMSGPDGGTAGDCLAAVTRGEAVSGYLEGGLSTAVEVSGDACARRFRLVTRTGGAPVVTREMAHDPAGPVVRTGSPLFDALYALAVTEARENAVDAIRDGAFRDGAPIECAPGGCFETGAEWHYVWTRDTAYAVDLGLAAIDAIRARNSLVFKTSGPREGGARTLVQDTGTGGSWPVSTDRVVWALGARALIGWLEGAERDAFVALAREAMATAAAEDDAVVFEAETGLYRGEQSFLDWREQSYPAWMAGRPAQIAMSRALGTNVAHLALRRTLGAMGVDGMDAAADGLRDAIRDRLLLPSGLPSAMLPTTLNPAPAEQYELLGLSLAILEGVLDDEEGRAALSRYPFFAKGPPVIWPQQQFTPIYHNRAQWPFVTAYALRAAARVRHVAAMDAAWAALWRGAALNRSNMENLEAVSGEPFVADGIYSGPVVNSRRQLWSVAGWLGAVHEVVFGVRVEWDGIRFAPVVTRGLRLGALRSTDAAVLSGLRWRGRVLDVVLHLPGEREPGAVFALDAATVDGVALVDGWLPAAAVAAGGRYRVELTLAPVAAPAAGLTVVEDPLAWRTVYAPRPPRIEAVEAVGGEVVLTLGTDDERAALTFDVLRDGVVVARGIAGATARWVDPATAVGGHACYALRARWRVSGWASHDSAPACWWGAGFVRVAEVGAAGLEVVEGERADEHGRAHVRDPGGAGVAVPRFVAGYDGRHEIQVVYGNGANAVETGITAAVRRVDVSEVESGQVVGGGFVVLPQLGAWDRWADSTFVPVELRAGVAYRIAVHGEHPRARNMSWLLHFADYTAGPGGEAVYNRANIAAIKVLARE